MKHVSRTTIATLIALSAVPLCQSVFWLYNRHGHVETEMAAQSAETNINGPIHCPNVGERPVTLEHDRGTLAVSKSQRGVVCSLIMTDGESQLIPIARSFGGDRWERYSGNSLDLSIHCKKSNNIAEGSDAGASYCTISLPPTLRVGMFYSLLSTRYEAELETPDNENTKKSSQRYLQDQAAGDFVILSPQDGDHVPIPLEIKVVIPYQKQEIISVELLLKDDFLDSYTAFTVDHNSNQLEEYIPDEATASQGGTLYSFLNPFVQSLHTFHWRLKVVTGPSLSVDETEWLEFTTLDAPTASPSTAPSKYSAPPSATPSEDTAPPSTIPANQTAMAYGFTPDETFDVSPSYLPTGNPSDVTYANPLDEASDIFPSALPSSGPTAAPKTASPSSLPTKKATVLPTRTPSLGPSNPPTLEPSSDPSHGPSLLPSQSPTTTEPTVQPSNQPSAFPQVTMYTCPSVGLSLVPLNAMGLTGLHNSRRGVLCTLVMTDGADRIVPVARSYDGFSWEKYSGQFFVNVAILCRSAEDSGCAIDLPPPDQGTFYALSSFSQSPKSFEDEVARFLEQATFGTTREAIKSFDASSQKTPLTMMAEWISDQQNIVSPSYHREFFRKRMNARFGSSSAFGQVTHPCEPNQKWRRFAFTPKHVGRYVSIKTAELRVLLSVDSVVMTMVNGPVFYADALYPFVSFPDGDYQICGRLDAEIGGAFQLLHPSYNQCFGVSFGGKTGNPPIAFDTAAVPLRNKIVILDPAKVQAADTDYYSTKDPQVQMLLTPQPLTDPTCNSVVSRSGDMPVIHGLFQGLYWAHDTRFFVLENSLAKPLTDGGIKAVRQTASSVPQFSAKCSAVPRSFVNEEYCFLNAAETGNSCLGPSSLVCGSPGEVANDLSRDGEVGRGALDVRSAWNETTDHYTLEDQIRNIWTSIAISGKDQLRQRVAWALSQILVVNPSIEGTSITEDWTVLYDIYVRNAFGNYRQILKEVAHSRMMGEMLSYHLSRSMGYQWINYRSLEYPDENFAREIMQLFSVGRVLLNQDGTQKLDSSGYPEETYSNLDIMELARAWTGFSKQNLRGNSASQGVNRVDPMTVTIGWRDVFPKFVLGAYLGDHYPLCADLPSRHFLKRGAKYRLLGKSPQPELSERYPDPWLEAGRGTKWFTAAQTAGTTEEPSLYSTLCGADNRTDIGSVCKFPAVVTLEDNLKCYGDECKVNSARTIQVRDSVFYEYIQPPCVNQAFFLEPRKIKKRTSWQYKSTALCADPRLEVAEPACCYGQGASNTGLFPGTDYWGEKVKLSEAKGKCPTSMCTSSGDFNLNDNIPYNVPFYWFGDVPCSIKAKLNQDGKVAVVHSIPGEDSTTQREHLLVDEDNPTFFHVEWNSGEGSVDAFIESCDSHSKCLLSSDGYCMCDVTIQEQRVFQSMPTREEVLSTLFVGAFDPFLQEKSYTSSSTNGVTMFIDTASGLFTSETIFKVIDDAGVVQFRKNIRSTVVIDGTAISFRNPVHFISLPDPALRDALYETDAVIERLLYHQNTAPFLAKFFAQRLGVSNPSPRYVEEIANAFRKGVYTYSPGGFGTASLSFGAGTYGDVGAVVAAILLDRESRSLLLDQDLVNGHMREPLVKLISLMRQLEFGGLDSTGKMPTIDEDFSQVPAFPLPKFKDDLQDTFGQMVFESPSVFNFFTTDYQPNGAVAIAGMVSPEAEIHTNPNTVALTNGLMSMIKYGLDRCFGGLGNSVNWDWNCEDRIPGNYDNSSGYMTFKPAKTTSEEIVKELATVMTSGRLSSSSREIIKNAIQGKDPVEGTLIAQQLIATTSAFHTTGTVRESGKERATKASPAPSDRPYRAVVVVMLDGGSDSFNLIVPHTCSGMNGAGQTLRQQYDAERAAIGMSSAERTQLIQVDGQPCTTFAIHQKIPMVKTLYDEGDLSFFMNTGVLNQPVTRDNFESKTVTQLFSHNTMQRELQEVDPFDSARQTGVLGRLAHILNSPSYGYNARTVAINKLWYAVNGNQTYTQPPLIVGERVMDRFNAKPMKEQYNPIPDVQKLNGENELTSNVFSELFSNTFHDAIEESKFLADALENVTLESDCGSRRLNMVVKLMETRRHRGVDRDMFFLSIGGWDHHADLKARLEIEFAELNDAIACYVKNVKSLGLWDNVTLMVTSDFGRSVTPNSNLGSDHGWGGHYFALGGALQERKVFGQYPVDITSDGPLNSGRGRMIPTMSWESMWTPFLQWLGVSNAQDLDYILPNAKRAGAPLIQRSQIFNTGAVGDIFG